MATFQASIPTCDPFRQLVEILWKHPTKKNFRRLHQEVVHGEFDLVEALDIINILAVWIVQVEQKSTRKLIVDTLKALRAKNTGASDVIECLLAKYSPTEVNS